MKKLLLFGILIFALGFTSCSDENDANTPAPTGPRLIVKFKFDENQVRLDNFGQPSTVLAGNAAMSPDFNSISAHYIELAPSPFTQLGGGEVIYHADETNLG